MPAQTAKAHKRNNFRISSAVKFIPKFDELDVEHYLLFFEKVLAIHIISFKEKWTALLHIQLTVKLRKCSAELSVEECHDYDILKQALFTAYSRVHEFCRNLTSKELLKPSKYKNAGQHTVVHSVVALLLQIPVVWIQIYRVLCT